MEWGRFQWQKGENMFSAIQRIRIEKWPLGTALAAFVCLFLHSCVGVPEERKDLGFTVSLPFMRMEPSECYYLDDFIPTPDSMVTGRSSGLYLRYYTYKSAVYKVWDKEKVMLAFYSKDNRCWSLFEEYASMKF
jgi:hypothetical protein